MVSRLIFGLKIENHICYGINFITRTSANIRKQEFMNTIKNLRASNLQKCHKLPHYMLEVFMKEETFWID